MGRDPDPRGKPQGSLPRDQLGSVLLLAVFAAVGLLGATHETLLLVLILSALGILAARATRRRMLVWQEGRAHPVGRLCLPVALIPLATGLGTQSRVLGLAVLGLLAICSFLQEPSAEVEPIHYDRLGPAVMLGTLLLLVWMRGRPPVNAALTAVAIALIVLGSLRRRARRDVISSVVDGVGVYLVASVVLHFVGLHSPGEALRFAGLETTIGVFGKRLLFPFAISYATAPALAAGYLAAIPMLMLGKGGWRSRMRPFAIPAAAFVMLGADYRAPLVYAALVGALVLWAPKQLAKRAAALGFAMLLLPFWYSHVVSATTTVERSIPVLHRGEQGGTLSSRDLIWSRTLSRYHGFSTIEKFVGFGTDGHVTSGASGSYATITRKFLAPSIASQTPPHSTALQELLDGGILAVCLYLAVSILALRRLAREFLVASDPILLAAVAMLLVFAATAGTEVTSAFGRAPQEPAWLLAVLVLIVSTSTGDRAQKEPARTPRSAPPPVTWPGTI